MRYQKVNKMQAHAAFLSGKEIIAIPCKLNPANQFFSMGAVLDNRNFPSFEKACNQLEYYSCSSETGRYLAFYLPH
jgi:hypothetical protein